MAAAAAAGVIGARVGVFWEDGEFYKATVVDTWHGGLFARWPGQGGANRFDKALGIASDTNRQVRGVLLLCY
jgi:hypothetical protein